MSTRLSLGSLSLVLDLTMKKGVDLLYTNWLETEVALLMSSRQGKTSQHKDKMYDVTNKMYDMVG